MKIYGLVILANAAVLIAWARYNQYRFGGSDPGTPPKAVDIHDLAALYDVPAADVEEWQQARILTVEHDASGKILRVTPQGVPAGIQVSRDCHLFPDAGS